jgi:hypothetical protein
MDAYENQYPVTVGMPIEIPEVSIQRFSKKVIFKGQLGREFGVAGKGGRDFTLTRSPRWQRTWRLRRGSATRHWDRLRWTSTDPAAEMEEEEEAAAAGPRRRQRRRDGAIGEGVPGEATGWGSGFVPRHGVWRRRKRGRGGGRGPRGGASRAATAYGLPEHRRIQRFWTRDRHDGVVRCREIGFPLLSLKKKNRVPLLLLR